MDANAVITGVGVVSAFGVGKSLFINGLLGGKEASSVKSFQEERFAPSRTVCGAFLQTSDLEAFLPKRGVRSFNSESRAFLAAALLACEDATLDPSSWERDGVGVITGTAFSGYRDYAELYLDGTSRGMRQLNPAQGPQTGLNAPGSQAAIYLKAEGPNLTLSKGTVSGLEAILEGMRQICENRAAIMLCGCVDVLSLCSIQALLSSDDFMQAESVARPFDAGRTGAVFGEGSVVFVLERKEQALRRGARLLGEIRRGGEGFEPQATAMAREAAAREAIQEALADHKSDEVDVIYASACGDVALDADEARALFHIFGDRVPVCAVKGALGEGFGVSGGWQAAAALSHLQSGMVPATAGYLRPDPLLPTLRITTKTMRCPARTALVHGLDPLGSAAALLIRQI